MKRIIILVNNDLSTDQRVLKVAHVFEQNNFEVLLLGRRVKNAIHVNLPFKNRIMHMLFNHSMLFYAEFNIRIFLFLLFSKYTHVLSNDTDTILGGYCGAKLRSKKLIFDAHELFPEIPELHNRKFPKWIWTKIEDLIFPRLQVCYTVCDSIANYYFKRYGIRMHVVRNIPVLKQPSPILLDYGTRKIILYQGALNKGRGLEWVIEAMPFIDNAVLVIIGSGDVEKELKLLVTKLELADKVFFLGRVPANELYKYSSSADLGLCLLDNIGLSYQYALPNRIFDYLHAGVPILATDFPEIRNIVSTYNTGLLINQYDPRYLASVINGFLVSEFDTSHFPNIAKELCWEKESMILHDIIMSKL